MSTQPPSLTDTAALARNRARAEAEALFLHDEAIQSLQDRLAMVNRTFTDIAVVTGFPDTWRSAFGDATIVPDSDVVDLPRQSFDLVIHAMSLHWANDPVGQLVQCRNALRPDGLLHAVCFGGQTLHELRSVLAEAEIEVKGGLSPRIAPMGEIRDLGGLLSRAGLTLPVADVEPVHVEYKSVRHLMRDLRAMGEGNALAARQRATLGRTLLNRSEEIYARAFPGADGRIKATFNLMFLSGWAPDASQPKPLRPGSASGRLAEALGTFEIPLKD